jgi:hypothetical protein
MAIKKTDSYVVIRRQWRMMSRCGRTKSNKNYDVGYWASPVAIVLGQCGSAEAAYDEPSDGMRRAAWPAARERAPINA